MLLLSSATKILATERPPGDTATAPHTIAQLYWSIGSHMRQRELEACVSEGEYRPSVRMPCNQRKAGICPLFSAHLKCFLLRYQGTTFFSPFFFLLLDSFLESFLSSVLCEVSVLFTSVACVSPLAESAAFAGCSLPVPLASAAGAVVDAPPA